jgi:hypothetical protein
MVKDVKLEPGWLAKDVRRAAGRVDEWDERHKAAPKPLTYADGLRRAAEIARDVKPQRTNELRRYYKGWDEATATTAAAIEAEIAKEKG